MPQAEVLDPRKDPEIPVRIVLLFGAEKYYSTPRLYDTDRPPPGTYSVSAVAHSTPCRLNNSRFP